MTNSSEVLLSQKCSEAIYCDTFDDRKTLYIASECVGWLTTLWEVVVAIYYWKSFMLAEMIPDEKMGWFHNHGLGKIESWLEKPLKYCTVTEN